MAEKRVKFGKNVKIYHKQLINLYDCEIGPNCVIGSFVEIGKGVKIGNGVKVQAFSFIPEGVTLEDGVFIGPHVCFINDKYPRAGNVDGSLKSSKEWKVSPTRVCRGASIGANSTILCGVTIGEGAMIGAGSVVTKNVSPGVVVVGNPAKRIK
ncbi:MAG: acyltransferase [bacterium]